MSQPDGSTRRTMSLSALIKKLRDLLTGVRPPIANPGPIRPVDPDHDQRQNREKVKAQVAVIREAFRGEVATAGPKDRPARDDADVRYFFRPGHMLVQVERLEEVLTFFRERESEFLGEPERVTDPIPGSLTLVRLPSRRDSRDDVLITLSELDEVIGRPESSQRSPAASPDHLVYVTGTKPGFCPATEPETPKSRDGAPWPPPSPSHHRGAVQDPVRVTVVDTGLWTAAVGSAESPWLESGEVVADVDDEEHVNPAAIHPYGGHGTFVAGVVRCVAPDALVDVEGALTHGGAIYESEIVEQLQQAIDGEFRPQIISISAGTHTRGDFASLGFEMFSNHNRLADRDDLVIVAAAGNDGSSQRFWPAAFDWVVSVGSVDPDRKVSDFSNHGKTWVDVYARGRNHVNAFPKGIYTCYEPPNVGEVRKFDGLAQWSGTSFSTPLVSGLIAAHMQATGDSARKAADLVINGGTAYHDTRINEDITIVGPLQ